MRSTLYYIVRQVFGQKQRNKLKTLKYKFDKKYKSLRKRLYGSFNAEQLKAHLETTLPTDYDILMVHCSHHDMIPLFGGSLSELLQVFIDLCGDQRTLVMPAFFLGDRKYHYDTLRFFQDKNKFEVTRVPSQMGMLSEIFRRYPNVKLSAHPTHRISVLGPQADELIANHENCRTGCGQGSPFDKMAAMKTVVIGSGIRYYECMTQTHSPEDILIETGEYPTKFTLNEVTIDLIMPNGTSLDHVLTLPDKKPFQRKIHPFLRRMLTKEEMKEWSFHGVPFFYAHANRVQQVLIDAAHKGKSVYFR